MIKELLVRDDSMCLLMSILVVADTNVTNKKNIMNRKDRRTKKHGCRLYNI